MTETTRSAARLSGLSPHVVQVAALALGASLHVAATIDLAGTNLRLGLTDLLLPLFLLILACDRLRPKHAWPIPRLAHCWWWLAALSGWMIVALLTGRLYAGSWQIWGFANKGIGWFVLVVYFLLGYWLSSQGTAARQSFLRAFFVMGWLASIFSFALFLLALYGIPVGLAVNYDRATGFLANPNAFGIAVAAQFALQIPLMRQRLIFPPWVHALGMAFLLLALLYSGSRSAWFGFAVALLALLIFRQIPWRGMLLAVSLAVGFNILTIDLPRYAPLALAFVTQPATQDADSPITVLQLLKPYRYLAGTLMLDDAAGQNRISSSRLAIDYWRDQPLLGIGLGSFLWRRAQTDDPTAGTGIHATGLWLMTETGLVGLLLFSAFFLAAIRALIWRDGRLEADPLAIGIAAVLVTLAAASLGTEILYQRYPWVLGGIGLALAVRPLASKPLTDSRAPPIGQPH